MGNNKKPGGRMYRRQRRRSVIENPPDASVDAEPSFLSRIFQGLMMWVVSDLEKSNSILKRIGSKYLIRRKKSIELKENNREFIDIKYKSIEGRQKNG